MRTWKTLCALLAGLLLAACKTVADAPAADEALQTAQGVPTPTLQRGQSGGVFSNTAFSSLTSDSRAFRPGDVLTVVLQETTQASKRTGTTTGKNSSASVAPTLLLGKTFKTCRGGCPA